VRYAKYIIAGWLVTRLAAVADTPWQPLFNGKDLAGWDTEMMILPDKTWEVPNLPRDANGNYTEAIGKNRDPLHVFTVTNLDGAPALHVSGQGFGVMMTTATFTNVHHSEAGVAPTDRIRRGETIAGNGLSAKMG
jgi:hypothetical protein